MTELSARNVYERLIQTIEGMTCDTVLKFKQIWEEIGYDETEIERRCKIVELHTEQLFMEMIQESGTVRQQFIESVERLLTAACELGKEIGIPHIQNFDSSKLKDAELYLQATVEEYAAIKEERMSRLAEYKRKDGILSEELGVSPRAEFINAVPSNDQLDEYENYLTRKEQEKEHLMSVYRETKIAIIGLIRELEITPLLNFHKLVVYDDESKFKPTKKNMALLKDYHHELENEVEETKIMALELREKLSLLWERLQEDIHHRELFLAKNQGYSATTISALKEELRRCEQLKQKNIKKFVGEIRKELEDWWDKCLVSEEERSRFTAYRSKTYTEDLLELHELEVQRLKKYYEDNICIFQLAVERQNLWDKMIEIESRAHDPERLFKNRGGQLLREEQERKNIQKELPKVEKELLKYLHEFEKIHGSPFYIEGEIFMDRITQQWAHHKANKESEKSARKARDQLSRTEARVVTNLTATKRKHPPTPTPSRSTKRRHVTSSTSTVKASRSNPAWKKEEEKRTSKVRRRILDRSRTVYSTPSTSQQLAQPLCNMSFATSTTTTTYSEFKAHIEDKNELETCRSSVAAARALGGRNSNTLIPKEHGKTTPAKPARKNVPSQCITKTITEALSARGKGNKSAHERVRASTRGSTAIQGSDTPRRLTPARGKLPIII